MLLDKDTFAGKHWPIDMKRYTRSLLVYSIILLSLSACNDRSLWSKATTHGNSSNNRLTDTASVVEPDAPGLVTLPISLSQSLVPHSRSLALSIQTDSKNTAQLANAKYDKANRTWAANIQLRADAPTMLTLTWSEQVRDQSLKLAQVTKMIPALTDPKKLNLSISNNEYKQSFDADGDGLSNLTETIDSTNPLDSSDPDATSKRVDIHIHLVYPDKQGNDANAITVQPNTFFNGTDLTLSFKQKDDKQATPVSDAEFDEAARKFDGLVRAIETRDTDALDRLATPSQQSDLFKQLMQHDYDRIEVSIHDIQLRNIDKTITGTLPAALSPVAESMAVGQKLNGRLNT